MRDADFKVILEEEKESLLLFSLSLGFLLKICFLPFLIFFSGLILAIWQQIILEQITAILLE